MLQASISSNVVVQTKMVVVYTDGSCQQDGCGGWAYHYVLKREKVQGSGGERLTSNNRMELIAVIKALESVLDNGQMATSVLIISDSQYVVKGGTSWLKRWKEDGWVTSNNEPVKNPDLWKQLDALCKKLTVRFQWVRGHAASDGNIFADKLATRAAALIRMSS